MVEVCGVCGLVNGLRMARGVITGEDTILEWEEEQAAGDTGNGGSTVVLEERFPGGEIGFLIMKFDSQGGLQSMERV